MFISIDIESDGPAPGVNSMLALGAAAFAGSGEMVSTWYEKLLPLPQGLGLAHQNPQTMAWWKTQPEAWEEVNRDQQNPQDAMTRFALWVDGLRENHGKPAAVAWPAAFDFAFVNYYLWRFVGENPLGIACLDIRSYANGLAKYPGYYGMSKKVMLVMAGEVDKTGLRAHVAVDDAVEQGRLFMQLRKYALTVTGKQ